MANVLASLKSLVVLVNGKVTRRPEVPVIAERPTGAAFAKADPPTWWPTDPRRHVRGIGQRVATTSTIDARAVKGRPRLRVARDRRLYQVAAGQAGTLERFIKKPRGKAARRQEKRERRLVREQRAYAERRALQALMEAGE